VSSPIPTSPRGAWHSRAWSAWLELNELTGQPLADPGFAEAAHQLGFARYSAGDLQGALDYYLRLLEFQPANRQALSWAGRLSLEIGDTALAGQYFEELLRLDPTDSAAAFQLDLIGQAQQYGRDAAMAYMNGISRYEQSDLPGALELFEQALQHNPSFEDAAVWAGRTAQELGDPARAERHWSRAVELDPADDRSAYFLQLARDQVAWGVTAANLFHQGQTQYMAGDVRAAMASFEEAAASNPEYSDALAWSARTAQELGLHASAARYWQAVLDLDPSDEGARYFLRLAEQQLAFGEDASPVFLQAVTDYQQARFDEAEAGLLEAAGLTPEFPPVWGYLGQLYFAQGRYAEAADAFERARELEPGNDEYEFFAMEARRLAGPAE
jgi:tetratricopeptide (TPR) repeat protein